MPESIAEPLKIQALELLPGDSNSELPRREGPVI